MNPRRAAVAVLLFLGACAPDETEFISRYAESECDYAIRCYDDSVLNFNGWSDVDTCVADRGPAITGDAEGCVYDKKQAKACLKAMKDLACGENDPEIPEVCTLVFACDDAGDTDATDTDPS